jgi:subtilisin family serine protease
LTYPFARVSSSQMKTIFLTSLGLVFAQIAVKNQYIVTFKNEPDVRGNSIKYLNFIREKMGKATSNNGRFGESNDIDLPPKLRPVPQALHLYNFTNYKGMAVRIPQAYAFRLSELDCDLIQSIEEDSYVNTTAVQLDPPSWGLRRMPIRNLPLETHYTYPDHGGLGTFAYVIDTGVWLAHEEFNGRIIAGPNYSADIGPSNDLHGHGTHVAGIVAGTTFGVAKNTTVVAIKVMDINGSGTVSNVIAGLNWAVNDAKLRRGNGKLHAISNLSLSATVSSTLNSAIKSATDNGMVVVVAAANKNTNACNFSPASEPSALTVGATNNLDARASFSNFGKCVDIFAPGQSIRSAFGKNGTTVNNATAIMSGTSMAAPHVAGAALLAMGSYQFTNAAEVIDFLKKEGTANVLTDIGFESPNLMAFVNPSGESGSFLVSKSAGNEIISMTTTLSETTSTTAAIITFPPTTTPPATTTTTTTTTSTLTTTTAVLKNSPKKNNRK